MSYVDGFVLSVKKNKLETYKKMAKKAGKVWIEHGALSYRECAIDHDNIQGMRSFADTADAKKNEVVIFAYIEYKSRAHRDKVNAKVMKDKRMNEMCDPNDMPFDCKRMSYGGFKTIVSY